MQVLVLTTQVRFKEFWRRWLMKIKLIFTRKVLDVASVWKWWLLELGHELFIIKISSLQIRLSQSWCPFFQYFNSFRFCHRHDRCIVIFILNQLHNPTGNFFWAVKKKKIISKLEIYEILWVSPYTRVKSTTPVSWEEMGFNLIANLEFSFLSTINLKDH